VANYEFDWRGMGNAQCHGPTPAEAAMPLTAPFKIRSRLDSVFVDVEDEKDAWVCLAPSEKLARVICDCLNLAAVLANQTRTQIATDPDAPIFDAQNALGLRKRRSEAA
jgi:hypothetical protein